MNTNRMGANEALLGLKQAVGEDRNVVIFVDDDLSLRKVYGLVLGRLLKNFFIVSATNGENALELLRNGYGDKTLAIISDVDMPEMNGIEFIDSVSAPSEGGQALVPPEKSMKMLITGTTRRGEIDRLSAEGKIDYVMGKPFTPAELSRAIVEAVETTIGRLEVE